MYRSTRTKTAAIVLTAGLGVALVSQPAIATTTPAPASATPPSGAGPAMTPAQKAMIGHIDANLATLKKSIGITPGEEPSWHGFTRVSRRNALDLAGLYKARAKSLATMNAVQNMESYAAISAKNADAMNSLSAAFQTLYATLTPTQQKTIDVRFRARAEAMTKKHLKKMKHS